MKLSVPQFGRPPSVVSSVYQLGEDITYTPNFVRFLTLLVSFGSQLWFASFTMIGLSSFSFCFCLWMTTFVANPFLVSPCCIRCPLSALSWLFAGVFDFAVALWQVSGAVFDFLCYFGFDVIFRDDQIVW